MQRKYSRILNALSKDSRVSTKALGKSLRVSQQTISYSIQALIKKGIIQSYQCILDPSRLGLTNVIVLYHYKNFIRERLTQLRTTVLKNPYIARVEEVSQGADILLEYSVPNLSFFNKLQTELLYEFRKTIQVAYTYVVIVKHLYNKDYLAKTPSKDELIICGDRDVADLTARQTQVLSHLILHPKDPITHIANNLSIDSKTVANCKRQLENLNIIKKFSILINYEKAEIVRKYILLSPDFKSPKEYNGLLNFALQNKSIVGLTKIIGEFETLLTIEYDTPETKAIKELRKNFRISNYRIIQSDKILKASSPLPPAESKLL